MLADADDGLTKIDTTFDGDTVWLSIDQMAELFQRDRSVIGKHVRNIFKEGELQKESVWAKFAYTAADGKTYDVDYYNLDVIISVGCNGVQREHNKKLNNGLPILHKVPPKRDYGRYFCIMAEKGGTSHGGLTEKLSLFFHAKKQEVNAYGR